MIFGRTNTDKNETEQEKILRMKNGVREFAWIPVKLRDGRNIWLDYYYCYYRTGTSKDGSLFLWSASPDSFAPYGECHNDFSPTADHVVPATPYKE